MVEPIRLRAGDASAPVEPVPRLPGFTRPQPGGAPPAQVPPPPKLVAWYTSMTQLWDYLRREAALEEARRYAEGETTKP